MGAEQPATAIKTVQVYVSRLRKALGGDRLESTPAGYVLHVATGDLDSQRFGALMDEARQALSSDDPDVPAHVWRSRSGSGGEGRSRTWRTSRSPPRRSGT